MTHSLTSIRSFHSRFGIGGQTTVTRLLLAFLFLAPSLHGQWVTERYSLKAGWNGVWLAPDLSHDTITNLLAETPSIEEVWRWNPLASESQFTGSPGDPVQADPQWVVWKREEPGDLTFGANAAYLFKVAEETPAFTLALTGRPVLPDYRWQSSGVNFFGFPVQDSDDPGQRNFESFLSYSKELTAEGGIFKYEGGPITENPVEVATPLFEPVRRGEAYWIRSAQFSDYYGPLQVRASRSGLVFGDTGSVLSLKLANVTSEPLEATLKPVASVPAPSRQTAVAGTVPLRFRGDFNPVTGQFEERDFSAPEVFAIEAGQEIEVVLSVDRSAMGGNAGDLFQGILEISDSEEISRIDLAVSAEVTSRAGLWVGTAVVTEVDQITAAPDHLRNEDEDHGPVNANREANGDVPSAFPLRLIVHRDEAGKVTLLQQVYLGQDRSGNKIVAVAEEHLDPAVLQRARRLSSATLPLDAALIGSGADLGLAGSTTFSSVLAHNASTNPFVHTYHPDHDNKNAEVPPEPLDEGVESYTVDREIVFEFGDDPGALGLPATGWGSTVLAGHYRETVSGLRAQAIKVNGVFVLRRVSAIPVLTR